MAKYYDYLYKLFIIGESGISKTCMVSRFAEDNFNDSHSFTIGVDFKIKYIKINGKVIRLQIWDTAGAKRYITVTKSYYKDANGIILVYDVTNLNTFKNIQNCIKEIKDIVNKNAYIVLVGNKIDSFNRVITEEEGINLANEYDINFFETSAKNDKNITELFYHILSKLLNNEVEKHENDEKLNKSKCEII